MGGAPCPHFENGKCTLLFWAPEGCTLSFSEHKNIEKNTIFNISVKDLCYILTIKLLMEIQM